MSHSSLRPVFVTALFAVASSLAAQRPLTHDDYDQWKSLRGTTYSLDGNWVAYQIEPQWGDGVLEIRESVGDKVYRQPLASGPRFTADGRFVVFTIGKSKVEERDKKIEELRKKAKEGNKATEEGEGETPAEGEETPRGETPRRGQGPAAAGPGARFGGGGGRRGAGGGGPGGAGANRDRGELAVLDLATGAVEKIGKVKGSNVSDDEPWLIYHHDKPEPKAEDKKADEAKPEGVGEGKTGEPGEAAKPEAKAGEAKPGETKPGETKAPETKAGETPAAAETKPAEAPAAGRPAEGSGETARAGGRGGRGGAGRRGGGRRGQAGGAPAAGGEGGAASPPADPLEKKRPEGTELVVRNVATGAERKIADVVAYGLSRKSKWLWYQTSAKKPEKDHKYGLFVEPLAGGESIQVLDGTVHISSVTFDRSESAMAFLSDKEDFAADKPQNDLYLWEGKGPARRIAYAGAPGMPEGKRVAGGGNFSRDGSVLEFDIHDAPAADPLPILPEDKVALDLWNWRDGQLQTQQQKRGNGERNPSWSVVWHRDQDRLVVLGDDRLRSMRFIGPDGSRMLATDGRDYEKETTWDGRYSDVWLVNSLDGSRTRLLEKLRTNVSNSPDGRYLVWFGPDYHWWSYDVTTAERRDLTGNLRVAFHREDDDHPEPDGPHGIAGWTEGDAAVLFYDEFDLWKVSPKTGDAVCVTDGFGRANHMRLRLQRLPRDEEEREWVGDELLLAATQIDTMAEGFFTDSLSRAQKPQRLYLGDKNIGGLTSPLKTSRLFFTVSTFAEFPDLWTANADFTGQRKLSDANPQQKDYRWGKEELVHWIDGDGNQRMGVLVKPDGFDPKKKYPMMVYFYERMSQGLHNYVAPAPGTSPCASYYVSNGYLWFMPDVVYEVGYPGMSCVKCVVSGVQSLISQGFVDEKAIGAAGHSWGGYQTAFLVTRTNIFKAVESGAPVSNMLSAYGGIRYESGVSRQFQYEQTQSRIGGTPWEYPLRYWENSPIYFADKVQTPVLIMANDNDGAVPWTQGIEYFTALRRLGKECYLFNYNGEPHGLRLRQNMKDWTRRMSEYFAHHLRGAPAPKWMTEGVPYYERDVEKLPFAQSYIDAHVKPAPAPAPAAVPATAPVEAKPTPASSAVGSDEKVEASAARANPASTVSVERKPKTEAAPAKLKKGDAAPDFQLTDEAGKVQKLTDYHGRMLLVWFYPKANTPGCTAEGCGLRDHFTEFEQKGVAVLGVSVDKAEANVAFRQKYEFPFPLLCDVDRTMSLAYGAADDASAAFSRRISVLIDGEGKVVQVWSPVDPRTFATTAIAALTQ